MVQLFNWLKSLFQAPRPSQEVYPLIEFNQEKCRDTLEKAAIELFNHSTEGSAKILQRALEAERNYQIMALHTLKVVTPETLARQIGRLDAFTHVLTFIQDALDPEQHKSRRQKRGYSEPRAIQLNKGGSNSEPVL